MTADARLTADQMVDELYAAHWRTLVRASVLLVRDLGTAEEVVQDAFVAMHGKWGRLRDPDKALAYLRKAVVNRSHSINRHRGVVERHQAREAPPAHAAPADEPVLEGVRRDDVISALQRLPRRQREVIALRYYLDLSEHEIAETLGISAGSVKSHASRGAAALRADLEDLR